MTVELVIEANIDLISMPKKISKSTDLTNYRAFGEKSELEVVRATKADNRAWLSEAPVCPALEHYSILHSGILSSESGVEVSRAEQSGTFMMVTLAGEGKLLADGRWQTIKAGQACLLPPFVANAFKSIDGKPWKFAWVRYLESKASTPIVSEVSPVSGVYDGRPMEAAIRGLIAEMNATASLAAVHHWVELIHHYVLGFAQPHQPDDRLWKLWNTVEKNLDFDWTLGQLAEVACLSEEHLRRLCKKQLGRSPVKHLTFLRMQRASYLLSTTKDKVEVIAKNVGYKSAFHFSNVFSNWVGCRPSEHRR